MKSLFILLSLSLSLHSYGDEINEFLRKVYNDAEYSRTKINTAEIKAFKDHINSTFQEALAEKRSITPRAMYKDYYELAQDLHFSGFSKEEYFKRWQKKYKELYSKKVPSKKDPNVFWLREYEKVFNEHFILIRTSPKACAKPGEISTITKCCNGAVSLPNTVKMNSCIEGSKSCNENSECCSNACEKSDPNKPGICLVGNKCFVLKSLGEACNESSPYCERGYCREINKGTLGMGECKPQKKSCKENTECCSNKCSRGKCVQNQICTDCASGGVKPKRGQSCCEGYYKGASGKCEIDMPPLVPFSSKVEKVFKTVISQLFPVAFAADENEKKDGLTEAQTSKIEDRERECAKTHNTSSDEYKDCMRSVEDLKKSYKGEIEGKLTQEQIELVEGKRHACLAKHPSGSKELAGCMNTVDEFEKEIKGQNIKLGIEPDKISSDDYLQKYKIPAVTAKTYSDIRKCEFNSFNDHWRDASNMEKNAELFLRAFEYVYSNEGTQDFWQEKNKDNIFKRANKVALNFRANRLKMFASLREVDKKMACKCLAIFGPTNYEADKQEFFNTSCEEEKAQLQATLGTDGQQSKIDGTSIDDDKTKDEKDIGEIEEVDKGAAGISHEKLLVEWLGLRRDAMTKRFVDNSGNEKDLDELSAFISGYDFEEVWKDKVSGNHLVRNTQASDYIRSMGNNFYGDSEELYSWYFIIKKGILSFILIIVLLVLAVFTAGASLALAGALVAAAAVVALTMSSSFGPGGEPGAYDLNHKKTKQGKWKEKHSFDRWYVGPRYDNYSPVKDTRCQIFARASSCLKTAYETKFNDQLHFLIDPTRPLFVPKDKVTLDLMPNYPQDYREMVNDARYVGVEYLRELAGKGTTKDSVLKKGKSYGKTASSHVRKAIEDMKFSPLEGKLKYQKFDEERKRSVVDGAKKYSLCLDLKTCGATGIEADALGFGFLFEDDTEAQAFADYAYGLHYHWSSLSKHDYLGYPLLGLDAYFKAVAYNMKILGSMSIKRAFNYDEAYRLYQADWEKRKSDYNSLGEGSVGSGSRNITYSKPFYNTLRLLDFDGISNIEAFDGAVANASNASGSGNSSSFNQAELDALSEARNHALRINKDVKKKQAYDALQGGKKGNAARQKAVGDFLTKLNAPGATIALKKFGGVNKGSAGNYNGLSSTASSIGASTLGKKGSSKENAIKPFDLGDSGVSIGTNSRGYGDSFSDDGEGSSSAKTGNANGLSVEEANLLIEGIGKNKDLIEARESDTLFERVSKAYLRSYDRVLVRSKRSLRANSDSEVEKKEKVSDSKKEELRQLLDEN